MAYSNSPEAHTPSLARSIVELIILCIGLTVAVLLSQWGQQHQRNLATLWLPNFLLIGFSLIWMWLGLSPTMRVTDGLSKKVVVSIFIFLCGMIRAFEHYWPLLEDEMYSSGFSLLVLVVLVPFAEEMFFRGILFDHLRRNFGTFGAVVAVSLLFGMLHAGQGTIVSMISLSLIACGIVLATGNVIWAVCIHITWNACAIMHLQTFGLRINTMILSITTLVIILVCMLKTRNDQTKAISQCPEA